MRLGESGLPKSVEPRNREDRIESLCAVSPPAPAVSRHSVGNVSAGAQRQQLTIHGCPALPLAIYAPRFLPTPGRPRAVALHFARRDQLAGGLAPPGCAPMLGAPMKKPAASGLLAVLNRYTYGVLRAAEADEADPGGGLGGGGVVSR